MSFTRLKTYLFLFVVSLTIHQHGNTAEEESDKLFVKVSPFSVKPNSDTEIKFTVPLLGISKEIPNSVVLLIDNTQLDLMNVEITPNSKKRNNVYSASYRITTKEMSSSECYPYVVLVKWDQRNVEKSGCIIVSDFPTDPPYIPEESRKSFLSEGVEYLSNVLILSVKRGTKHHRIREIASEVNAKIIYWEPALNVFHLLFEGQTLSPSQILEKRDRLKKVKEVEWVTLDSKIKVY